MSSVSPSASFKLDVSKSCITSFRNNIPGLTRQDIREFEKKAESSIYWVQNFHIMSGGSHWPCLSGLICGSICGSNYWNNRSNLVHYVGRSIYVCVAEKTTCIVKVPWVVPGLERHHINSVRNLFCSRIRFTSCWQEPHLVRVSHEVAITLGT